MVSVRCMCGLLPGGKSITAKRDPFVGGAVPRMRAPMSSTFSPTEMSAGARSVHQIRVEAMPGPEDFALVAGASRRTLAMFVALWPVTTRRIGGLFELCLIMGAMPRAGGIGPRI